MKTNQKSSKKMSEYTLFEGILADDLFKNVSEILNEKQYTGKVKSLSDFSEEEILALEKQYNTKIIRRTKSNDNG